MLQTFPQNPQESAERRLYLKSFGVPNHALPAYQIQSRFGVQFGPIWSILINLGAQFGTKIIYKALPLLKLAS